MSRLLRTISSYPAESLLVFLIIVSIASFIGAYDMWVWFFEIIVAVVGVLLLFFTRKRFQFSHLIYILVGAHVLVLALGAHYTYELMPLFDWIRDAFGLARNHFDRVGHFMQGFVPILIIREFVLRITHIGKGKILNFLLISTTLGISAFWELIEMWTVMLFYYENGQSWLGMQGDIWDAHWDMSMALIGSMLALLLLSRFHDRSMDKVIIRNA